MKRRIIERFLKFCDEKGVALFESIFEIAVDDRYLEELLVEFLGKDEFDN